MSDLLVFDMLQPASTWSMPATSAKLVPAFFTISMRAVPNSLQAPGCLSGIRTWCRFLRWIQPS